MPDDLAISESAGRDITVWRGKPFIIGIACFFAFMVGTFFVMSALTRSWSHGTWPLKGPPGSPVATARWNRDAPQLEINPGADLKEVRKVEDARLHTVRWSDSSHAYACIPIEQAMALVAQAAADHRQLLPPPLPATPLELQNQKSQTLVNPADAPAPLPPMSVSTTNLAPQP